MKCAHFVDDHHLSEVPLNMYYSTALIIQPKWDRQMVRTTKMLHNMEMGHWAKQTADLLKVQYKYEINLNVVDK
jgi:hypothetical protein